MAFASMISRASSTVLPLAIRASGAPRTFRTAVTTVLAVQKQSLAHNIARGSFLPLSRFATSAVASKKAEDNLVRVLDSEIDCADEPRDYEVPDGFPFKIEDNEGERTIILTRNFEDETIKVEVDMLNVDEDEDTEDDKNDDDDEEASDSSNIPMVVTISKGNGQELEFGITAYPDEITIDNLSIKNPSSSEDRLPYEGPDFGDLDENLQKAFHKYLEIRGIKPSTTNFLLEYMTNKDSREYLNWLNNLKKFVEK
ncbi:Uncharacterized protein At2g39795, mitochondrial [Linum perenne]